MIRARTENPPDSIVWLQEDDDDGQIDIDLMYGLSDGYSGILGSIENATKHLIIYQEDLDKLGLTLTVLEGDR